MFRLFSKSRQSKYPDVPSFSDFTAGTGALSGEKIEIRELFGKPVVVVKCRAAKSIKREDSLCLQIQLEYRGEDRVLFSGSDVLLNLLLEIQTPDPLTGKKPSKAEIMEIVEKEKFCILKTRPFRTRIIKIGKYYAFA